MAKSVKKDFKSSLLNLENETLNKSEKEIEEPKIKIQEIEPYQMK
jgi:hypothetical protein